ncbi:hypothetical protein Tco_0348222 [Tanacetum coccineum]
MKVVRSDDKISQLLTQLRPQHEVGSGSGSGGGGDEDAGEDEDADGDEDNTTAAREMRDSYYDWMGKFLKIMLGFLPTGAVGICYAYKSTHLYHDAPHAHIYMAWYAGIGFALAFIGKGLREGIPVDVCWLVASVLTLTFVSTAISQVYKPNTEKYILLGGVLIGGGAFLSTILRFHLNMWQLKKKKEREEELRRQLKEAIAHLNPFFLQPQQQHPDTPPANHIQPSQTPRDSYKKPLHI